MPHWWGWNQGDSQVILLSESRPKGVIPFQWRNCRSHMLKGTPPKNLHLKSMAEIQRCEKMADSSQKWVNRETFVTSSTIQLIISKYCSATILSIDKKLTGLPWIGLMVNESWWLWTHQYHLPLSDVVIRFWIDMQSLAKVHFHRGIKIENTKNCFPVSKHVIAPWSFSV